MGAGDGGRRPVLPPFRAIADASALIALRQLGLIDLIAPVFAACIVPPADAVTAKDLDPGESEVLSLGLHLRDRVVVLDDGDAHTVVFELGLDVIGTLGLLVAAKRRGIVPLVGPYLDRLPGIRFFAAPALLRGVLRAADEGDGV